MRRTFAFISRRPARSTGLVAVLFIAMANFALMLAPALNPFAELRDADRFLWYVKTARVRERVPEVTDARLLILGDSQAMSGIIPEILDERLKTQTPSINLGMPSQQPEGLLVLARFLPSVARDQRRRVIVNVNPFSLFESPVKQSFDYYFRQELARYDASANSLLKAFARPGEALHQRLLALPLYEANYILAPLGGIGEAGLSDFPFAQLRARPDLLPADEYAEYLGGARPGPLAIARARIQNNRRLRSSLDAGRGFWTWKKMESPDFSQAECRRRARSGGDPALSFAGVPGSLVYVPRPAAVDAYRRLLDVLSAKGYETLLVEIPFSPAYGNLVNEARVYAMVSAAVEKIAVDQRPGVVGVLGFGLDAGSRGRGSPAPLPLPDSLRSPHAHHDLTHLSACGAAAYTRWLATELLRRGL